MNRSTRERTPADDLLGYEDGWNDTIGSADYIVPRFLFPLVAVVFVLGAGFLAAIMFGAGLIGLGVLLSVVVAVGMYVLWTSVQKWRLSRRRSAGKP